MENKLEGPYKATEEKETRGWGRSDQTIVRVQNGEREICKVEDLATAELIASALNLWEMGAEDDTLDQLTSAHQMNLGLSHQCAALTKQADDMRSRLPTDEKEDYGDNLIETANALLKKAGKGGSYDLSTFDSARISDIGSRRERAQHRGEDVVTVRAKITLQKKCIKSGDYGSDDQPETVGSFGGIFGR